MTAAEVANVLTFVAPGFFALAAYRYEFPRRARDRSEALVVSVAASVPIVALTEVVRGWIGVERNPLGLGYVALLLGLSLVAGYAVARLRGADAARRLLRKLGFHREPEDTPFIHALRGIRSESDAQITVTFKDGDVLGGTPESWSSEPDDRLQVFVTHYRWYDRKAGAWGERRDEGGVLVSIDDTCSIEFDRTPGKRHGATLPSAALEAERSVSANGVAEPSA